MQLVKLSLLLSLFVFTESSFASFASEEPEKPLDYLFGISTPHYQVKTICGNSVDWFRNYFGKIKASGYYLNAILGDGNTLLHLAIKGDCPSMIQALLEAGADVYKTNSENESALQLASYLFTHEKGYEAVWQVFEAAGYDLVENDDEENDLSAKGSGQADEDDAENDLLMDQEDNMSINSSAMNKKSRKQLEFDPDEVVKILNEIPDDIMPIPDRYQPIIPIQVLNGQPIEVGEKYLQI